MKTLSKILITGLVVATGITAAIAASTLSQARDFTPAAAPQNYSVIYKTDGVWPLKGMISVEPCSLRRCIEA
jgi:hypothetical protein